MKDADQLKLLRTRMREDHNIAVHELEVSLQRLASFVEGTQQRLADHELLNENLIHRLAGDVTVGIARYNLAASQLAYLSGEK